MVGIDQARHDDMAFKVDRLVRRLRQICARPDRADFVAGDEDAGMGDFAPLVVHGQDEVGVFQQEG